MFLVIFFASSSLPAETKKALTLYDIFESEKFDEESLENVRWMPDSKAFTFLKTDSLDSITSIYRHDAGTGEEAILLDGNSLRLPEIDSILEIDDYDWSEDGRYILIQTRTDEVWRYSETARYYVYDLQDRTLQPVRDGEASISNAEISPDGANVGYVFENDIYIRELTTGETNQKTFDGSELIINGQFDWVYEEEFWITKGWEWSPDGGKIAFWRLDQANEPEFPLLDYDLLHLSVTKIHYPKAGDKNALVKIGVIDIENGETTWIDLGEETDIYVPRITWTNDPDLLCVQRLNRSQNRLDLIIADVQTGKSRVILTETDPCWVDIHDNLVFLENSDQFIWTSEKSGFNHIYLYDNSGTMIDQLTEGEWEVRDVLGVDEATGIVYYRSNQEDMKNCHVYGVDLKGKNIKRLTDRPGWHNAEFSPDYRYFMDIWSDVFTPEQSLLCSSEGEIIRTVVENKIDALDEYELSYPEFSSIRTGDHAELNACMMKPADFDSTVMHPVLIRCYGGPGSQTVRNAWGGDKFLWYNLLVQQGYIIFCIDNRGTGGRGKEFVNLAYGDVGRWAVHDHIEAAKYLSDLPYIDADRIGIWGWSFGGYLTLLAMTKGANYFAAGVAGAPVVCWKLYDTIYTERYMGLPGENSAGYDSASLFSYADRLKGNLLIIHGTADDNVHVQNTMQLAEKFQSGKKQFELMLYPGQDHSVSGDEGITVHLYTLITDFILGNL